MRRLGSAASLHNVRRANQSLEGWTRSSSGEAHMRPLPCQLFRFPILFSLLFSLLSFTSSTLISISDTFLSLALFYLPLLLSLSFFSSFSVSFLLIPFRHYPFFFLFVTPHFLSFFSLSPTSQSFFPRSFLYLLLSYTLRLSAFLSTLSFIHTSFPLSPIRVLSSFQLFSTFLYFPHFTLLHYLHTPPFQPYPWITFVLSPTMRLSIPYHFISFIPFFRFYVFMFPPDPYFPLHLFFLSVSCHPPVLLFFPLFYTFLSLHQPLSSTTFPFTPAPVSSLIINSLLLPTFASSPPRHTTGRTNKGHTKANSGKITR